MLGTLLKRIIFNDEQAGESVGRRRCGVVSGMVGIVLNLLLFAGKLAAGLLAGAVSIMADAFNNLSDAASSVVTLIGFHIAGRKPDAKHPFGHGRMEYLSGLVVSMLILLVGVELGKESIYKIVHPEQTKLTVLTTGILIVSILVKIWMGWFNGALAKQIRSEALRATATDSRMDALATAAVLVGLVLSELLSLPLDGWMGLLVAVLILKAGLGSIRETIDPLLGQPPDPEEVEAIRALILSHRPIRGIHDLVIHDYGPGRKMMSVHAEVPAQADIMEIHDVIDQAERELKERFEMDAVIHMDPVQWGDPQIAHLKRMVLEMVKEIEPRLSIHDFRATIGPELTNLIFDVVVPYETGLTDEEVLTRLTTRISTVDPTYHAVIEIDHCYVL